MPEKVENVLPALVEAPAADQQQVDAELDAMARRKEAAKVSRLEVCHACFLQLIRSRPSATSSGRVPQKGSPQERRPSTRMDAASKGKAQGRLGPP